MSSPPTKRRSPGRVKGSPAVLQVGGFGRVSSASGRLPALPTAEDPAVASDDPWGSDMPDLVVAQQFSGDDTQSKLISASTSTSVHAEANGLAHEPATGEEAEGTQDDPQMQGKKSARLHLNSHSRSLSASWSGITAGILDEARKSSQLKSPELYALDALDKYLSEAALAASNLGGQEASISQQDGLLAAAFSPQGRLAALAQHFASSAKREPSVNDIEGEGTALEAKEVSIESTKALASLKSHAYTDVQTTAAAGVRTTTSFDVLLALDQAEEFVHNRLAYLADLDDGIEDDGESLDRSCRDGSEDGDSNKHTATSVGTPSSSPKLPTAESRTPFDSPKTQPANSASPIQTSKPKEILELLVSRRDSLRRRALGEDATAPLTPLHGVTPPSTDSKGQSPQFPQVEHSSDHHGGLPQASKLDVSYNAPQEESVSGDSIPAAPLASKPKRSRSKSRVDSSTTQQTPTSSLYGIDLTDSQVQPIITHGESAHNNETYNISHQPISGRRRSQRLSSGSTTSQDSNMRHQSSPNLKPGTDVTPLEDSFEWQNSQPSKETSPATRPPKAKSPSTTSTSPKSAATSDRGMDPKPAEEIKYVDVKRQYSNQRSLPRLTSLMGGFGRFAQERQRLLGQRQRSQEDLAVLPSEAHTPTTRSAIFIERTSRLAEKSHSTLLVSLLQRQMCDQLRGILKQLREQKRGAVADHGPRLEDETPVDVSSLPPNGWASIGKATKDMEECAMYLLQQKADPNHVDADGASPLHLAVQMDDSTRITALLLKEGADPNTVCAHASGRYYGWRALDIALLARNSQLVRLLLMHGGYPTRFSCVPDPPDEHIVYGLAEAGRRRLAPPISAGSDSIIEAERTDEPSQVLNAPRYQNAMRAFAYPLLSRFPMQACLSFLRANAHLLPALESSAQFLPMDNAYLDDQNGLTLLEFARVHGFAQFAKGCLRRRLWSIICTGPSNASTPLLITLCSELHGGAPATLSQLGTLASSVVGLTLNDHSEDSYEWVGGDDALHGVLLHGASVDGDSPLVSELLSRREHHRAIDQWLLSVIQKTRASTDTKILQSRPKLPYQHSSNSAPVVHSNASLAPLGAREGSPLVAALRVGRPLELVRVLLDWNATVDATDADGNTPLALALLRPSVSAAKLASLLLERGASPLCVAPILADDAEALAMARLEQYISHNPAQFVSPWLRHVLSGARKPQEHQPASTPSIGLDDVLRFVPNNALDDCHFLHSSLDAVIEREGSLWSVFMAMQRAIESSILALAEQTVGRPQLLLSLVRATEKILVANSSSLGGIIPFVKSKVFDDLGLNRLVTPQVESVERLLIVRLILGYLLLELLRAFLAMIRSRAAKLDIALQNEWDSEFNAVPAMSQTISDAEIESKLSAISAAMQRLDRNRFPEDSQAVAGRRSAPDSALSRSAFESDSVLKRAKTDSGLLLTSGAVTTVRPPATEPDDIFQRMLNSE